MGGKRRLASQLIPLFPEHSCYVELFCGGAALYFLRDEPAKVEVINDLDGELINLYRVVQNHLEEFVKQFKWSLTSRQMFKWLKEAYVEGLTDIQRAARFYYLQQHAFGGKRYGQNFGTATTGKAPNLLRIEESLSEAYIRLAGTYIENLSWVDCLKSSNSFIFSHSDPNYLWDNTYQGSSADNLYSYDTTFHRHIYANELSDIRLNAKQVGTGSSPNISHNFRIVLDSSASIGSFGVAYATIEPICLGRAKN